MDAERVFKKSRPQDVLNPEPSSKLPGNRKFVCVLFFLITERDDAVRALIRTENFISDRNSQFVAFRRYRPALVTSGAKVDNIHCLFLAGAQTKEFLQFVVNLLCLPRF